ncbi:MAG TPA: hypothetical protein VEX13_13180, partial [Chloroflexia bacterium]|nr:hypothetical protein [Chloroflexia bacterium]
FLQRAAQASTQSSVQARTPSARVLPTVQRAVNFTLKETKRSDSDLLKLPIVSMNPGARPPFIDSRVPSCGKDENVRHRVGYDLIAKALKNLVKGLPVEDAHTWLSSNNSWVDSANAASDRGVMVKSVPGVEHGLTKWLQNASSYPRNLFCGSAAINKRKGSAVPRLAAIIKSKWYEDVATYTGWNEITLITAKDKRSNQEMPFYIGSTLQTAGINPSTSARNALKDLDYGVSSLPGSQIHIQQGSTTHKAGAFKFLDNRIIRVSRSFGQGPTKPKSDESKFNLAQAREAYVANQLDTDESTGYTESYMDVVKLLNVQGPDAKNKRIAYRGLGSKYAPEAVPSPGYHKWKDYETMKKLQLKRANDHQGASLRFNSVPDVHHSPAKSNVPPTVRIQRNVSIDLQYGGAMPQDAMMEQIASVNTGDRPPLIASRLPTCGKRSGLARRHRVGYDLIARGLEKVLQNATVEQVAAWLDNTNNWLSQGYLQEDRTPLVGNKTIRSLSAVEAMATKWLINAHNNPRNIFCGSSRINSRKGRAVGPTRRQVKESWETDAADLNLVGFILALDKRTDKQVNFDYGGTSTDIAMKNTLLADAPAGKLIKAPPGTNLVVRMSSTTIDYRWGAAHIFQDATDGSLKIKRVGRSYVPQARSNQDRENTRIAYVANQIDTPEVDRSDNEYPLAYEDFMRGLQVSSPHDITIFIAETNGGVASEVNRQKDDHVPKPQLPNAIAPILLTPNRLGDIMNTPGLPNDKAQAVYMRLRGPLGLTPGDSWKIDILVHRTLQELEKKPWYKRAGKTQGIAEWALEHDDGKYRPSTQIPVDYHRTADEADEALKVAERKIRRWRFDGHRMRNSGFMRLPTIGFDTEDIEAIIKAYVTGATLTDSELGWVRTTLRGKNAVKSYAELKQKVDRARRLSTHAQKAIKAAFKEANMDQNLQFPT